MEMNKGRIISDYKNYTFRIEEKNYFINSFFEPH
jgi:hypothetical protein